MCNDIQNNLKNYITIISIKIRKHLTNFYEASNDLNHHTYPKLMKECKFYNRNTNKYQPLTVKTDQTH